MLGFIKQALSKVYEQISSKLQGLFAQKKIDEETLKELEKILLSADTGVPTTKKIIQELRQEVSTGQIQQGTDLKKALNAKLLSTLKSKTYNYDSQVFLLVGINGSGKTTFASKLAYWLKNKNKKVLLAAADTFRAAAVDQLIAWSEKLQIPIVIGKEQQDPASVVYKACQEFKDNNYDHLIIDTAGRLQNKVNLMKELEKIKNSIKKLLPNFKISTLLTIDSMLGQNSFDQAKLFSQSTDVDGIVLTKLDGTAKGGIVFSINHELGIPVAFISLGEQPEQMNTFNPETYVEQLLS